jgi:hypothetical protein
VVRICLAVVSAVLVLPFTAAYAFAASTQVAGYGGSDVQTEVGSAAGAAGAQGTLPFTGFDLTLIALGGLILLCIGFFVRRRASERAR